MENKRLINGIVIFFITMFIFMGKFDVTKLTMYQSLVVALSSAIIAFGMEHILTLNVVKEYDEMKHINSSGGEPLILITRIIYAIGMILTLMDADMFIEGAGVSMIFSSQGILLSSIALDNMSIYVGNKYMYFQNKFIKLEDIVSFTQTDIKTKRGKDTNRVEVIVETKQGKKYKIVLSKLATGNLEELESRFCDNTNLA